MKTKEEVIECSEGGMKVVEAREDEEFVQQSV